MMQLVLHDQGNVLEVTPSLSGVVFNGNEVSWIGGKKGPIHCDFVILEDHVEVGETLTAEQIAMDQRHACKSLEEQVLTMQQVMNVMLLG
jgi:hypothetical protein